MLRFWSLIGIISQLPILKITFFFNFLQTDKLKQQHNKNLTDIRHGYPIGLLEKKILGALVLLHNQSSMVDGADIDLFLISSHYGNKLPGP